MMKIDKELINSLFDKAVVSERKLVAWMLSPHSTYLACLMFHWKMLRSA